MALPTIVASPSTVSTQVGGALGVPLTGVLSGDVIVAVVLGCPVTSVTGMGATWTRHPGGYKIDDLITTLFVGQGGSGNGDVFANVGGRENPFKLQLYVIRGVSSKVVEYDGFAHPPGVGPGQVIVMGMIHGAGNMAAPGATSYPSPAAWDVETPVVIRSDMYRDDWDYTSAIAVPSAPDFDFYALTSDNFGLAEWGVILGVAKVDQHVTGGGAVLYLDAPAPPFPNASRTDVTTGAKGTLPVTVGLSAQEVPLTAFGMLPVQVRLTGAVATLPLTVTMPVDVGLTAVSYALGSVLMPYPVTDTGSQVLDFSYVPAPGVPWPFPWEGEGYSNSLWLTFTAAGTQTLTLALTAPFSAGIEVWSGDPGEDLEELTNLGYGTGTLDVAVAPGQRILMRAHPKALDETRTATLTWSVAARSETGVLGLVCDAVVLETPGWLGVSLLSATPDSPVTFALDGGATFYTVTTEEDGTFAGDVELPSLTVGPHALTATDVSGQTETVGFAVTLEVPPDDTIPGSTPPVTAPSPLPVIHWVLEDPKPGGLGAYTFPVNPSEMSSPWPEKQIRPERAIHGSGNDIVWEGRADAVNWTVKGSVLTQGFYDTLTAYHALNRRLYVVDHHQMAWVVAFDGLTFEKKGRPDDLWFHSYTAIFVILGGPVPLS